MIRFLSIKHLAVIDALELELEPGLTVLTGETGAGKSIVVEALGLLLGDRSTSDLVRTGERNAVVQGIFELPDGRETIVRRKISAQGRSRAFIDDTLATSAALKTLGVQLVDLHGQHEHQLLLDPTTHLDVLDAYAKLDAVRQRVAITYTRLRTVEAELDRSAGDELRQAEHLETLRFQLSAIDAVAPQAGEDEQLAVVRERLANAETVRRACAEGYHALYEGDAAILPELAAVWKRVEHLAALDPRFAPHLESRQAITAQLEELAFALRDYGNTVDATPERLEQVEERLAALERVKRTYGPGSLSDVLAKRAALAAEIERLETASTRTTELRQTVEEARREYLATASDISRRRQRVAPTLTAKLETLLAELAMEQTRCEIRFDDRDTGSARWSDRGVDVAALYLSPNPGEDLRPLARIASGGELSRVMLALKTLASPDAPGKTLVFDEVDVGIGGRVATVVGKRLRELGDRFQVLCVTHLPQIAAYGTTHYQICKSVRQRRTTARAARLSGDERVAEIARMLTGDEEAGGARRGAQELLLLGRRNESEQNTNLESRGARAKRRARG